MLSVRDLSVWVPGTGTVLESVSFDAPDGVTAIVGRNGAGASTLINALLHRLTPGSHVRGNVTFEGHDVLRALPDYDPPVTTDPHEPGVWLLDGPGFDALRARFSRPVLWATHDVDAVWQYADWVVELDQHRALPLVPVHEWEPATLPEPTTRTLARLLRLPTHQYREPAQVLRAFEASGHTLPALPRQRPSRHAHSSARVTIGQTALTGEPLTVRRSETLGMFSLDHTELPVPGELPVNQLNPRLSVRRATRRWEKHLGVPKYTLLETATSIIQLRPDDLVMHHSPGQQATLLAAAAVVRRGPQCLSYPERHLDSRTKAWLAARLLEPQEGPRVVLTADPEFAVRACHQLAIVQAGTVLAVGAPSAVAHWLPERPLVSAAVGSTQYLRLTDVVSAVYQSAVMA